MKKSTLIHVLKLLVKYDVEFLEDITNCDTYDEYEIIKEDYLPEYVMPFDDWNYLKELEWEIYEELEQD